jgi:hypothetical protein
MVVKFFLKNIDYNNSICPNIYRLMRFFVKKMRYIFFLSFTFGLFHSNIIEIFLNEHLHEEEQKTNIN